MIDVTNKVLDYLKLKGVIGVSTPGYINYRPDRVQCVELIDRPGTYYDNRLDDQDTGLQIIVQGIDRANAFTIASEVFDTLIGYNGKFDTTEEFRIIDITSTSTPTLLTELENGIVLYSMNFIITYCNKGINREN